MIGNIQRLLAAFRSRQLPVIYLGVGRCLDDGRDLPAWMRDFDKLGLELLGERVHTLVSHSSWQIDDRIAPMPGEIVVNKTSSGALPSTKLDQTLHNLGVNSLVVCGLTTAVCVTQTARETADRGFRVVVAEDACTEMHRAAQSSSTGFRLGVWPRSTDRGHREFLYGCGESGVVSFCGRGLSSLRQCDAGKAECHGFASMRGARAGGREAIQEFAGYVESAACLKVATLLPRNAKFP